MLFKKYDLECNSFPTYSVEGGVSSAASLGTQSLFCFIARSEGMLAFKPCWASVSPSVSDGKK